MKLNIIFEDNQIIIVEKPQNLLSQSDITGDEDMVSILKKYIKDKYNKPGNVYIGLVHRLDRPVGGIMVFARTSKAAARLSEQIREHKFIKNYLAVVHSNPKISTVNNVLSGFIYKLKNENYSEIINTENEDSKLAELEFKEIESIDSENKLSLIKICIKTGRSHQIRVQLANSHFPIYGDMKYGLGEKGKIALWSNSIKFIHPTLKTSMEFESFPPLTNPWNKFKKLI